MVAGLLAVIIAYLLGSVPGAYIVTRFLTGKDIRKLGGGNVGAHNVYAQIGMKAAIPVAIIDVAKGAISVVIAFQLLGMPPMQSVSTPVLFVLAAGLAAIAGHIWPVYLRFKGGNGIAPTIGVLIIMMPRELLVILGLALVFTVITRNPLLSVNLGLLILPVFVWFSGDPKLYFIFLIALEMMLIIHFIPDVRAAFIKAGGTKNLIAELVRTEEPGKKAKKGKRGNVH